MFEDLLEIMETYFEVKVENEKLIDGPTSYYWDSNFEKWQDEIEQARDNAEHKLNIFIESRVIAILKEHNLII